MAVQHSTITDPDIHEPKGISAAAINEIYIADGEGSGAWTNISELNYTGWSLFEDTAYTDDTAVYLAVSTTPVTISNNKLGTATDETQAPLDAGTTLFNASTSNLQLVNAGDLYSIQLSFTIHSVSGTPSEMLLKLEYTDTSDEENPVDVIVAQRSEAYTTAGQHVCCLNMLPATADLVLYGGKIKLSTDDGTINLKDIKLLITRIHKAR